MREVGKTIESWIYRIADSLWHKEVRERLRDLVTYIEKNDTSNIWKELDSPSAQDRIIGYRPTGTTLYKFKQAALAIAYIKNEYPRIVSQLASAGEKIFTLENVRFAIFTDAGDNIMQSKWRKPIPGSSKKEVMIVNSLVLLLPGLARIASFQTGEKITHRQFQHGHATNLQLYAAFSKLKGISSRKMHQPLDTFASFEEIRFLFRTIRDARTVYDGMRLENFSFLATHYSGVDSFQMAFYFVIVGQVTNRENFKVGDEQPAGMRKYTIKDKTGEQEFMTMDDARLQNKEHMGESIQKFFQLAEHVEKLKVNNYVVALVRWSWEHMPEIVYMKYLGEAPPKRLDEFYLLAYMNTRKKVPINDLKEAFPDFVNHKHLAVHGDSAYFVQEVWDIDIFEAILSRLGLDAWVKKNINERFAMSKYFRANEDATKLYTSTNPAKDFIEIYNVVDDTRWFLRDPGNLVRVGNKPIQTYVKYAMSVLAEKGSARIVARGAKITNAKEVCGIISTNGDYSITGSVVNKIKFFSYTRDGKILAGGQGIKINGVYHEKLPTDATYRKMVYMGIYEEGWRYVDEIQITLVKAEHS